MDTQDLVQRAVEINIGGGNADDVWQALSAEYKRLNRDAHDMHMEVLDAADAEIRRMFAIA